MPSSRSEPGRIGQRRPLDPARGHLRNLVKLAFLFVSGAPLCAAPALSTNAPPILVGLPDAGTSVLRVFGALALVLALFLAGVWLFRNWRRLSGPRGHVAHLQVLESKALGGRHALYVVGYQHQRLLLAASPSGVT